jgi:meiotically up-regulated gene 157 (Mug157) protein
MVWSAFRPSDDEQTYGVCDWVRAVDCTRAPTRAHAAGYLIPSNMFAVSALRLLAQVAEGTAGQKGWAARETVPI